MWGLRGMHYGSFLNSFWSFFAGEAGSRTRRDRPRQARSSRKAEGRRCLFTFFFHSHTQPNAHLMESPDLSFPGLSFLLEEDISAPNPSAPSAPPASPPPVQFTLPTLPPPTLSRSSSTTHLRITRLSGAPPSSPGLDMSASPRRYQSRYGERAEEARTPPVGSPARDDWGDAGPDLDDVRPISDFVVEGAEGKGLKRRSRRREMEAHLSPSRPLLSCAPTGNPKDATSSCCATISPPVPDR